MEIFGASEKSSPSAPSSLPQPIPQATTGENAQATTIAGPGGPLNAKRATKEMTQEEQRMRSAALADLEPGALYITLFYMTGNDNEFHWALYHYVDEKFGGWKYHVVRTGGYWHSDHGDEATTETLASNELVGLIQLKDLGFDRNTARVMQGLITAEDTRLSQVNGLSCRAYVARACERLKKEELLDFSSWDALQAEILAFGNKANKEFANGQAPKPRPVIRSAVAK